MKFTIGSNIIAFVFASFLLNGTANGQASPTQSKKDDAIIYRHCTIPYELRALFVGNKSGTIFMLTEEKYFSEADLRTLFICLGRKYAEIPMLTVILFSDPDQLRIAVKASLRDNELHENPTPDTSTKDCANPISAVRPCPYGYFRARYFRFDKKEHFEYSESPSKVTMTRINLQN